MASPPAPAEKPSDAQTLDPLVSPSPPLSPADQQSPVPAADPSAPKGAAEATPAKAEGSKAVEGGEATEQEAKDDGLEEEEEEEEMECGFCLFMKGGGCKDAFIAWENCITIARDTGEDATEKCMEVTSALMKCMEAKPDYYEPILRAEKAMNDAITDSGDDDPDSEEKVKDD
ncbi:uncharacterized protein LOC141836663 [Curcuma longa]|uniref:uncharacterized protein LOC141836663 n=1 Tax=Curcuma longa TaxID=136217 RepID=UPI003D9DCEB8